MSETNKVTEIPLSELFPTAYLNPELRGQLDDYLKFWLENIEIIRQHNPDEAELMELFIKESLLNLDGYNAFNEGELKQPKADNQDSFLKEWNHEIKNILVRTNSIKGKENLYDLSDVPEIKDLETMTNQERSVLHFKALDGFIATLSEASEEKLIHQTRDQVKWWGEGKLIDISLNKLIATSLSHSALHTGLMQSPLLSYKKKLPFLYSFDPKLTK